MPSTFSLEVAGPADPSGSAGLANAQGAVSGAQRAILRLEGAVVLAASAIGYAHAEPRWALFAGLFLVPDLSMLGYLAGRRVGATAYNAGHSYLAPALLAGLGVLLSQPLAWSVALIWVAHIGFDRMLGYGLKSAEGFGHTHLSRVGKVRTG